MSAAGDVKFHALQEAALIKELTTVRSNLADATRRADLEEKSRIAAIAAHNCNCVYCTRKMANPFGSDPFGPFANRLSVDSGFYTGSR